VVSRRAHHLSDYGPAEEQIGLIVDRCKLPLSKVGVHDQPPLGCGAYGCVYPTPDGRAVKVVDDRSENEASGALWLMALGARRPAELPFIYGVYRLQNCLPKGRTKSGYVIVREAIGDLRDDGNPVSDEIHDVLFRVDMAGSNEMGDCTLTADLVRSIAEQLSAGIKKPMERDLLKAAVRLQVWACRNGVRIYDTHPGNWGRRANGDFVLRDFGKILATADDVGPANRAFDTKQMPAFGGLRGW